MSPRTWKVWPVLILLTCPAAAQPSAGTGIGTGTCAVFAKHYQGDPKLADLAYGSWAQGFMTGLNVGQGAAINARNTAAMSTGDHLSAFRRFCDAHPLAIFVEAVLRHYHTLPLISP